MGRLSTFDHMLINKWELGETVGLRLKDGRAGTFKVLLFDVETLAVILEPVGGGERLRVRTSDIESVEL
jgi:hypothetical protein